MNLQQKRGLLGSDPRITRPLVKLVRLKEGVRIDPHITHIGFQEVGLVLIRRITENQRLTTISGTLSVN